MSKKDTKEYELGEAELAVLRVLWQRGALTVREVMMHLHEKGRKVAYTTVLTFLTRLEQKGYVSSNKEDTAYVYRAKVSRESVTRSRVRALLDQLYDGRRGDGAAADRERAAQQPGDRQVAEVDRRSGR